MENKTLVLDYSKWRCGEGSFNQLGLGKTCLENTKGYQCCLGQFSLQLSNLTSNDILQYSTPSGLGMEVPLPSYQDSRGIFNTDLSRKAMMINDDHTSTPQKKVILLRTLFDGYGIKIKVINGPKDIPSE